MLQNFIYRNATEALPDLFGQLGTHGKVIPSRNGRTLELAHTGITLVRSTERELLVPYRNPNLAAQIAETMWVLGGQNDIEFLQRYLPRAVDYSDDGATWRGAYGKRLRNWHGLDQIDAVVKLLKKDPDTRQAVAMIYNPLIDSMPGKDVPCNNWLSFLGRDGALDLHVAIRSNDAMWGWSGINAFEWSALLEVVAKLTDFTPGALHFSITSFHLYEQHWEKARRISAKGAIRSDAMEPSPAFECGTLTEFDGLVRQWFILEEAIRQGVDVVDEIYSFPEPMMRSWLHVIAWWWTGDTGYLLPIIGTRLGYAVEMSIQPPERNLPSDFLQYVSKLHAEKHAAYGDSWKRRGEMLGILANIARKIDRLGMGTTTSDETAADTAIDLMVYLAKYHCWVRQIDDGPECVDAVLAGVEQARTEKAAAALLPELERVLTDEFMTLENHVMNKEPDRLPLLDTMLAQAYELARARWSV